MGQAFDESGNVLGEAHGNTKREVFEKLISQFADAKEIRIRSIGDDRPQTQMPAYRSHKTVWALKIKEVQQAPAENERQHAGGDWLLVPEDSTYAPICVGHEYYAHFKPYAGGYYVVYKDGYQSFSPATAFEEGYTRL